MVKKMAFTLAEVLIVLMAIGIIAEITIPTLVKNIQTAETVGMLKKEYSVLSQAYTMAVQENGTPESWDISDSASDTGALNLSKIFVPYLKIIKDCGLSEGCWAPNTYTLSSSGRAKLLLADGTSLGFYSYGTGCTASQSATSIQLQTICGIAYVDLNGAKAPNLAGKDVFVFNITRSGVIPRGVPDDSVYSFGSQCLTTLGTGCTAWVIYNENMDYLKCSNLAWNGNKTCQ